MIKRKCKFLQSTTNLQLSWFFGDDSSDDLDTLPVASTDAEEGSPTGPYTITLSGGSDDNYDFRYVNGKLLVSDLKDQTINFSRIGRCFAGGNN